MSNGETVIGAVCRRCSKPRGRRAKGWVLCSACGGMVCYGYRVHNPGVPEYGMCNHCADGSWRTKYEADKSARATALITCVGCRKTAGATEFAGYYLPEVCKACESVYDNVAAYKRRIDRKGNAKPGLVEVVYEACVPAEDGGSGYAYRDPGYGLKLGDVVLLPPNAVSQMRNGSGRLEGTVVSTYSDYDRAVSTVIGVVKRASDS